MSGNPIDLISKIGNYALPAFGAFLTASFTLGNISWSEDRARYFLIILTLYTIISVFISYFHRLLWLRHRNKLKKEGKTSEDLPFLTVIIFLILHATLISVLVLTIYKYSWL